MFFGLCVGVPVLDAFIQHEAAGLKGIWQARAFVEIATKSNEMGENMMLSEEDIEARRRSCKTWLQH